MEYTVFKRSAPKSVSATLSAKNPDDALETVISAYPWDKRSLSVVRYGDYEDYMSGILTKQELLKRIRR